MGRYRIIVSLFTIVLVVCAPSLLAETIWVAAEYSDEFVDDPDDGIDAFVFEGRDAITGGGIYFTSENIVQGATETTYYEYDLGECSNDDDGSVWRAWGRFEWTGGISGCNSFGLIWLQTNGTWTPAKNFGNDDPWEKPWHWKDIDTSATLPALSAGDLIKVRITERESQTDPELTPLLDVFCLTTDAVYIPTDDDVPEFAPKVVGPGGKLGTTWAQIKRSR